MECIKGHVWEELRYGFTCPICARVDGILSDQKKQEEKRASKLAKEAEEEQEYQRQKAEADRYQRKIDYFVNAAKMGDTDEVKAVLRSGEVGINETAWIEEYGFHACALYAAVRGNHPEVTKLLLAQGASIGGMLETACRGNDLQTLRVYLEGLSKEDQVKLILKHNLMRAAVEGNAMQNDRNQLVRYLLAYGVNVYQEQSSEILFSVATSIRHEILQILLESGFDANSSHNGWPILHYAVSDNNRQAVSLLLKYGADIDAKDKNGNTAQDIATKRNFREIAADIKLRLQQM